MKNSRITSLLALGLAVGMQNHLPALANKADVEAAEKQAKMWESKLGLDNPTCTTQYMILAGTYLRNGMNKDADAAFKKVLDSSKSRPNQIPQLMISWANSLSSPYSVLDIPEKATKEEREKILASRRKEFAGDLPRAKQLVEDASKLAEKMPPASKERLGCLFSVATFYQIIGDKVKEQAQLKLIDNALSALENDKTLSNENITTTAYYLTSLANIYCSAPSTPFLKRQPPAKVVDGNPANQNDVSTKNFKIAEGYQLRAIAQYDRLPETVPWRLDAHRYLILWYRHFGQTKQEELQTQQLCKLMHTTDRSLLFPEPPPCPACGMG